MRLSSLILVLALISPAPLSAQDTGAGGAGKTDAEKAFQDLVAQCDDNDVLFLRARIRLELGRTTQEAAATAQTMLDNGMKLCGEGNVADAKTTLDEAYKIAQAGVSEKFGQDGTAVVTKADDTQTASTDGDAGEKAEKPWWQFW